MRALHLGTAVAGTTLLLGLTGCGATASDTSEPARAEGSPDAPSATAPSPERRERITPAGVAAVVREHLGRDVVRRFSTYEPEPGSVSVMVRLRDATPHNFAVQVYSPKQVAFLGEAGTCPDGGASEGEFRCRTLANGTTIMTIQDPHGFSDDNADGMVISGSAVTADDGGVLALYESYDDSPAISVAEVEELLTDPRLTWLTDPAVNKAGAGIHLDDLGG